VIVLDTHAWLWWAAAPDRLGAGARQAIDETDRLTVSTVSCFEVVALAERGRISLSLDAPTWIRRALAHARLDWLAPDPATAVRAALLPRDRFPGDPIDRLIYATALELGCPLLTRDRGIRSFDPARTVW